MALYKEPAGTRKIMATAAAEEKLDKVASFEDFESSPSLKLTQCEHYEAVMRLSRGSSSS